MQKIKIITHYAEDDPSCENDYYQIEIFVNDKLVKTYGDQYHDKGREKAQGFMDGIRALTEYYSLTDTKLADYII